MFTANHYVPMLKSKQGEFSALKQLSDDMDSLVTPMLECLPIAPDGAREHIATFSRRLVGSWFRGKPIFLDMNKLSRDAEMANGYEATAWLYDRLDENGIQAIPVWSPGANAAVPQSIRDIAQRHDRGVCLRLPKNLFLNASSIPLIRRDIAALELEPSQIDVIVDFFQITEGELITYRDLMPLILGRIPNLEDYRSFTLASGAFPDGPSTFRGPGTYELPRRDWMLWSHLASNASQLVRMPSFGDYATIFPRAEELDTSQMRPAASIKYTTEDAWIVFRGTKTSGREGFEQYRSLARQVVAHEKFKGTDHCSGDRRIVECAEGISTTGNPASWVGHVMAHHITFAARQVASWPVASA
jgi:hypothetical protein